MIIFQTFLRFKVVVVLTFFSRLWATPLIKIIYTLSLCFVLLNPINDSFASDDILPPQLKFKSLTTKQGLSQSYVYDIAEDKQGFMWIATQEGLNRFDGN